MNYIISKYSIGSKGKREIVETEVAAPERSPKRTHIKLRVSSLTHCIWICEALACSSTAKASLKK